MGPVAVVCACGCGNTLTATDERGRSRRFIHGHNQRKASRKPIDRVAARKRAAEWYANNGLQILAKMAANREEYRGRCRKHYWRNPAKSRSRGRDSESKKRAKRTNAAGYHNDAQWLQRVQLYGWLCRYCGKQLSRQTLTKDHSIPLVRGGSDWPSNLVPACKPCNSGKGKKTFAEYVALKEVVDLCAHS